MKFQKIIYLLSENFRKACICFLQKYFLILVFNYLSVLDLFKDVSFPYESIKLTCCAIDCCIKNTTSVPWPLPLLVSRGQEIQGMFIKETTQTKLPRWLIGQIWPNAKNQLPWDFLRLPYCLMSQLNLRFPNILPPNIDVSIFKITSSFYMDKDLWVQATWAEWG